MASIASFSGIASGIEWRDLVDQMMKIESNRRLVPVQDKVTAAQSRKTAWNQFSSLLSAFSTSAEALQDGSAFGVLTTSVAASATTGKDLLTAAASDVADPGSYQVEVIQLARSGKLSGSAVASATEALGVAGEFYVNGEAIEVSATDSLNSIRDRINAANTGATPSGVSATILATGPTEYRLVLTSNATGSRGIELADGDDGVLQSLGITTGAFAQNSKPGDATSTQTQRFASSTSALADMLGISAPPAVTTIDVDGHKITVDLEKDTLVSLMNQIAAAGGTASIDEETVSGTTMQRLTVAGSVTADAAATDPAASQRLVELLGFQKGVLASSITAGQDAEVEIDGFTVTERTNVVTDVINGVTLNLVAAEPGTKVDLSVKRDLDAVVDAVKEFAAAYNELIEFADKQRQSGAPLSANASFRSTMLSLSRTLLDGVSALPESNSYTHASLIGIERNKDGQIEIDEGKLRNLLTTNLGDVKALLTTSGYVTDGEITYLGATSDSAAGAYDISITAAATHATHAGSAWADVNAYAASNGTSDTLSLADSVTGNSVDYVLQQGQSLSTTVTELNALFAEDNLELTASADGGALRITSNDWGSVATFTVGGSAAPVLGMSETTFAGGDVEGTIGGVAASGVGQILTGDEGGVTDGIAVRYTGTTARDAGQIRYVLGVGGMLDQVIEPTIRDTDGVIPLQVSSLDRSIDRLLERIDKVEAQLDVRRQALVGQFTRMESALSLLQSQSTWLTGQISSLSSGGES